MKPFQLTAAVLASALAFGSGTAVSAATYTGPITGTPSTDTSFGTRACGNCGVSTNLLNYEQQNPTRFGQPGPHVLFAAWDTIGTVTLSFWNEASGLAFFEYRIDGAAAGTTAHPIVIGDTIHPGVAASSGTTNLLSTFTANEFVEVRLALGGERDWDFDWTRFDVKPIPLPAAGWLLLGGLGALGAVARRKRRKAA